jgi:thioredoxin reductase
MENFRDIIIIGAGPAGLSAAVTASEYGLDVLVLDEQLSLGGQLYRNIERASKDKTKILGPDYGQGLFLAEKFRKSKADYMGNAIVWRIDPNGNICFSTKGTSFEINAKNIIIATGAMERPVPFPGWTLPGVMGAGAVDANFKSSSIIPNGPVVLAGSGPLLLSTAGHLASLGITMPIRIAQVGALGYDPLKIAARAIVSDYSDLYDGTQILRISRNQMNLC